jgi:hypothetical protein
MALVLVASVAASWAFPDEGQPQAAPALGAMRHDEAHAEAQPSAEAA